MRAISSVIIGASTLLCSVALNATKGASHDPVDQTSAGRAALSIPDDSERVDRFDPAVRLVRVENVRLEAPVPAEALPSALLKFDVFNGTSTSLTDVVLEISILEKPATTELVGRAVVRPFKIRGTVVLEAGYTINYSMLLRNVSSDCRCVPNVDVVSVHWLPETH
jgi:hypothetical protein